MMVPVKNYGLPIVAKVPSPTKQHENGGQQEQYRGGFQTDITAIAIEHHDVSECSHSARAGERLYIVVVVRLGQDW